jgi:formate hydrogenlyase subunit 3/multisubunit Na+/H+ antiporter MnhD subunit
VVSLVIDAIGYVGAALILVAYFLLTHKKLTESSTTYHALNLLGGLGVIVNATSYASYPSTVLNIIWSAIAVYGLVKGLKIFKNFKGKKK